MKKSNMIASTLLTGALLMQGTVSDAQLASSAEPTSNEAVRPFTVNFPEEDLVDLKRRSAILVIQLSI